MIVSFIAGILFNLIAQYARLSSFDTIVKALLLRRHDVILILLFAIAVSSLAFFLQYLGSGPIRPVADQLPV